MSSSKGFTLTEVLVVLAILALTITLFSTTRPGPSPAMQQEALISDLIAKASQTRAVAINEGKTQILKVEAPLCDNSPGAFTFFPNGTATGARICLSGVQELWVELDPFTGHLHRVNP